jgi:hypothetical protein
MKSGSVIALIAASALSWPSFAQTTQEQHPMHSPATRVGQVSPEIVAQLLREHGFSDVSNLRLEAGIYRAEATKDGARMNIEVDALSGRFLKP